MVVKYPAAAESGWLTFVYHYVVVLCKWRGSILPSLVPQIVLVVLISVLAQHWNPFDGHQPQRAYATTGFLVCFLVFFKAKTAHIEFMKASSYVEDFLFNSRRLALLACSVFKFKGSSEAKTSAKKIIRYIAVYFFVTIEYFKRTGPTATRKKEVLDLLRNDIRNLTGPREFRMLYPCEDISTPGSASKHVHTNPLIIIAWIQFLICDCQEEQGLLTAPVLNVVVDCNMRLLEVFWEMNRIDKTQFPFPMVQLVKLLNILWLFTFPFVLQPVCLGYTPLFMIVIATGFLGCEHVADILEKPFGNDANDFDLRASAAHLLTDLELIFISRDMQTDSVFQEADKLDFSKALESLDNTVEFQGFYANMQKLVKLNTEIHGAARLPSEKGARPSSRETPLNRACSDTLVVTESATVVGFRSSSFGST